MIVDPATVLQSEADGLTTLHLSVAGGLSQFGAYIETLAPGASSSNRHWHSAEDEFVYVLDGVVTLHDDDGLQDLSSGDAVAWRHGDPNAHRLINRGDAPCQYLIAGSRVAGDICHYPDSGRRQVNADTTWHIEDADGTILRHGDLPTELLGLPPVWGNPYDPSLRKSRILRAGDVRAEVAGNSYPAPWNELGISQDMALSDAGGLSQFGAYVEVLHPRALTSLRHWHEAEDEFLYVLEGTPTLIENDGPQQIAEGTCVCWPKGVPNGHCLRNDTATPVVLFIIGTRLPEDECHYPDIDLHYSRRNGQRSFNHKDGTPYPGWPKETNR